MSSAPSVERVFWWGYGEALCAGAGGVSVEHGCRGGRRRLTGVAAGRELALEGRIGGGAGTRLVSALHLADELGSPLYDGAMVRRAQRRPGSAAFHQTRRARAVILGG